MSAPRLSVLMPVYNGQRYLREAVESILAQSFVDFELIAIDDGSTDLSRTILDGYAQRDARVRVLSRPNTGIVGALNDGLRASRADLIARMDADDVAFPQRFQLQIDHLDQHPEIVMLGTRVIMIDGYDWPIGDMASVRHGHEAIDDALLGGRWPIVHPTVVMRRKAVEEVGGYHEGTFPNEDHALFLRLAEMGRLENLREPLLKYRRHFQSVVFAKTRDSQDVKKKIIHDAMLRRGLGEPKWEADAGDDKPNRFWRREWAWTALKSSNIATARKFALGAVGERPWCKEDWRILYYALRGR